MALCNVSLLVAQILVFHSPPLINGIDNDLMLLALSRIGLSKYSLKSDIDVLFWEWMDNKRSVAADVTSSSSQQQ